MDGISAYEKLCLRYATPLYDMTNERLAQAARFLSLHFDHAGLPIDSSLSEWMYSMTPSHSPLPFRVLQQLFGLVASIAHTHPLMGSV